MWETCTRFPIRPCHPPVFQKLKLETLLSQGAIQNMSADGDTVSSVDFIGEQMERKNLDAESKICKDSVRPEAKENVNVKPELALKKGLSSDKNKERSEMKKMGKPMIGLPPINVNELTTILQGPDMPSHNLMKEIAQKIKVRSAENESKSAAINKVNPMGIRSVFDCIMEVTLTHSDDSSDEEEDEHEPHVLEMPCDYCKKIFGSTMTLKTHVLMSHSQDDPSVLNVRLRSSLDDKKLCDLSSKTEEECKKDNKQESHACCDSNNADVVVTSPQANSALETSPSVDSNKKQNPQSSEFSDSDKMPTSKSSTALESTSAISISKFSLSSLRKNELSDESEINESQDMKKSNPDLKEVAIETPKTQSMSLSASRGKRKTDSTTVSPNSSTKKSKQSRRSKSGEDGGETEKESVNLRRSSRFK